MCSVTVVSSRRRNSICGSSASTCCGLRDSGPRSSHSRTKLVVCLPCVELALISDLPNICCVKRPDATRRFCLRRMLSHCMGVVAWHFASRQVFRTKVSCAMSVPCRLGLVHAAAQTAKMHSARLRYTVSILNDNGFNEIVPCAKDTDMHLQRSCVSYGLVCVSRTCGVSCVL